MSGTHAHRHAENSALSTKAASASVAMALTLIGLKSWAAVATGSMAMLGSLADTALDLIASVVTLVGVRIASRPADSDHRFGHGKAEAVVALVQTVLIAISAVAIAVRSVQRLLARSQTQDAGLGILVSLVAIALTIALISYQRRVVRRTQSVAIATDRLHYSSDLLLNLSVIAALALEQYAGLIGADPIFALLIAGWLVRGAWRSSLNAVDQLMDREWPEEERQEFLAAAHQYPELAGLHDFRTRSSGTHRFAQFHVWIPASWTVKQAHDRLDAIEEQLQERFPGTEILIHVDPEGQVDRETLLSSAITEKAE